MARNRTIATWSMHLKHPLGLPWRRIYIILSTEIIFSQPIGPAKKNLRLFIEGVKIWTGPLALVSGCMLACFIHGTSIQNRKSNWICASDLNHWPWDCPVCDFQSKIPSSAVTGGREETSRIWKTRTEPGVKYEVLPGRSHSLRSKCILKGLIAALKPPERTISLLWQTELLWGGQLGEIVCFYVKHATRLAIK